MMFGLPTAPELGSPRLSPRGGIAWWLAALLVGCWLTAGGASAANFTATLDRDSTYLGEPVTLTLTFEGGSPRAFPSLSVSGARLQGMGTSQQISFVNGQGSRSEVHTYQLTPLQVGEIVVPAMKAEIGGQTFNTPALKLVVLKPGTPPPAASAGNGELAFVRLVLPKTEAYVGEVLPGQLEIYLRDSVLQMKDFQLTPLQAEGFTVGKMSEAQHRQARVGNFNYTVVPLPMAFTAVKAGTLSLGPAACTMTLLLGPPNFFGQPTRHQQASLASEPVTIKALPLPREGVPPGFGGAVGSFSMQVEVAPTNIAVGDPITVKVQVSGRGAVDAVTLPAQTGWDQFKAYPPTSNFEGGDQSGLSGTKSFALTVVPQNMEVRELPPFIFSYFDPELKKYQTLTRPAVPLTIRPSTASLPPPTLSNANAAADSTPARGQDIVHIKARPGAVAIFRRPLVTQAWFLGLQIVPVGAWLALLVSRRRQEMLARNPRLRRQRQVEQTIREGLQELDRAARANEGEAFFATLFRLLQEQLGERLDLPASAITEAALDERLRPGQWPESVVAEVHQLFHACNQARYSRTSSAAELASLGTMAGKVLAVLKNLPT